MSERFNVGNEDIRYSLSDGENTVDKYTQKQYNNFGWARTTDAISKNELDDMYSKIHEKGSLAKFKKSTNGEAIIEVNDKPRTTLGANNVFAFVKGTKNEPQITRVVRVNLFDEASIDVFRKDIYERNDHRTLEAYARVMGEELIRYYDRNNSASYGEYTERTRSQQGRVESERDTFANRNGSQRSGTAAETQSNEIAPIKQASSTDGVFFDAKEQPQNSLWFEGDTVKEYGNLNVYGKDLKIVPTEDIAPMQETVSKKETVEDYAPLPSEPNAYELEQKKNSIAIQMSEANAKGDIETRDALFAEYKSLRDRIAQENAKESAQTREYLNSLTEEDVPPETDIFYPETYDYTEEDYERLGKKETYSETLNNLPDNPLADRNIEDMGDRKVKAYQYENPEVKPFFQQEAEVMLDELHSGLKGERYTINDGSLHPEWTGQKRVISEPILVTESGITMLVRLLHQ